MQGAEWRTGRIFGQPRCASCKHCTLAPNQDIYLVRHCDLLGVHTRPDGVCKHHPDEDAA